MATTDTLVGLTERQAEIFCFIRRMIETHGRSPTVREIAARFGMKSPNSVTCHLRFLERKGRITKSGKHKSRNIRIVGKSTRSATG